MPADHRLEPTLRDDLLGALTRSSTAALEASEELLANFIDTGDGPTQRAVNTLIEQAADALRSLTDSLVDFSGELQGTVQTTAFDTAAFSCADAEGPSARLRPGHDHRT